MILFNEEKMAIKTLNVSMVNVVRISHHSHPAFDGFRKTVQLEAFVQEKVR